MRSKNIKFVTFCMHPFENKSNKKVRKYAISQQQIRIFAPCLSNENRDVLRFGRLVPLFAPLAAGHRNFSRSPIYYPSIILGNALIYKGKSKKTSGLLIGVTLFVSESSKKFQEECNKSIDNLYICIQKEWLKYWVGLQILR